MSDGSGRTLVPYCLKAEYGITERVRLLKNLRLFHSSLGGVSVQALNDIIDDVFNTFPSWLEIEDPLFKQVFNTQLDPNTVRNLLRCDLDLGVRSIHLRSLHVIDAFSQIIQQSMPTYLNKYFPEGFRVVLAKAIREWEKPPTSEDCTPSLS